MSQDDDSFDVMEAFGNAPVPEDLALKDERKKRRAEKAKLKAEEKLEKNRENREKKRKKKEKMKKRKRGEEVSDDSDQENDEEKEGEDEKEAGGDAVNDGVSENRPAKKAKTEKGAKEVKKAPGVWIGNLSYSTTEADLKAYFSSCGEITRIKCPPGRTARQKNQGFAFIDFTTEEAVASAVAKSEKELNGRALLIKDSKNYEKTGRPKREMADEDASSVGGKAGDRIAKKQKNPPSTTVFVGNLSFAATREAIKEQFEPCGRIRKVRLATFEDSGKCKGFAYIDFFDVESATKALRAPDKHMLDGRKLRLEYASEEATKKATPWVFRQERKDAEAATNANTNEEVHEEPKTNEREKEERIARKMERETRRKNAPAKEGKSNATSGAILANVQRQKMTAQPFQGKKITFD
ncbi:Nucleolar protein 13 [Umbelopsis nana]